jgi:hypothetical protein
MVVKKEVQSSTPEVVVLAPPDVGEGAKAYAHAIV